MVVHDTLLFPVVILYQFQFMTSRYLTTVRVCLGGTAMIIPNDKKHSYVAFFWESGENITIR